MNATLQQFLTLLIPVIVGIVTVPLMNLIKRVVTVVDTLPAAVQQLIVLVVTYLLNLGAHATGIALPDIANLDATSLGAVVSAVLAYLLHLASQISAAKAVAPVAVSAVAQKKA